MPNEIISTMKIRLAETAPFPSQDHYRPSCIVQPSTLAHVLRLKTYSLPEDVLAIVALKNRQLCTTSPPLQTATQPPQGDPFETQFADCPPLTDCPSMVPTVVSQQRARRRDTLLPQAFLEDIRTRYKLGDLVSPTDGTLHAAIQALDSLIIEAPRHDIGYRHDVVHDVADRHDVEVVAEFRWTGTELLVKKAGVEETRFDAAVGDLGALHRTLLDVEEKAAIALPFLHPDWHGVEARLFCWPRGWSVYSATRFGTDWAVYPDHPDLCHADALVVPPEYNWSQVAALGRIATNTKKVPLHIVHHGTGGCGTGECGTGECHH
ncbi:tRNA intron endonuclease, catalytic carboxy-terminal domain protein [Gregarina niphandrodes]|uniref:tRNA-intron lyase n=1 Tax=Gregarina niphandrodes TaxID=110365 RepID=A0A023AZH1_GRENI|nr:tRNA intron endonuclease, catalytic carboxy-terminal domain protein [Gregarina niphandrodes]EZG44098.1 tRNA intron endonuclease, catalytic carboxy-terminal domain protein [Gregarina niphandrodes]|eukprot:XP_011132809.1 tRNA intron endonuclease, catalytic carboxy-terminal domain protein [Gregarina niphandrodes]